MQRREFTAASYVGTKPGASFLEDTTVVKHESDTIETSDVITQESSQHHQLEAAASPMEETDRYPKGRVKNMVSLIEDESQIDIVGHDGRSHSQNGGNIQMQAQHLHTMYLREKPLLDKISHMRQDNDSLRV